MHLEASLSRPHTLRCISILAHHWVNPLNANLKQLLILLRNLGHHDCPSVTFITLYLWWTFTSSQITSAKFTHLLYRKLLQKQLVSQVQSMAHGPLLASL